ncbi:tryptophan synthase subunit alpha [Helicobacter valdiviensis]|uniref:Tryptophan synthase alpha chain n=1 Tax=Helicobacter valdiviensis TaxID=1458358 RepID=A0A2W6PL89_9HELI|nr:tryptophan synthase subunit alpha [Helicobacter valdiviensis]PZT47423.1 tryptophan synthase subunit alpha [Helicobacter valdiviensis]
MQKKQIDLMGHIVAGFPSYEASLQSALGISLGGAKYLEVQFPFSDPNADGESIANACEISLQNGFNTKKGFAFIKELNSLLKEHQCTTKILIMTYANILYAYGIKEFLKEARKCEVFGLIVPDLSLDSDENLFALAKLEDIEPISLIAKNTPTQRMTKLCKKGGNFVYVVARNGITGDKTTMDEDLFSYINLVKKHCNKPIALGFGIQNKEQIQALRGIVPIVVVGSAFNRKIQSLQTNFKEELCCFTKELLS